MARKSDEERKAHLQQRIAALKDDLRRIDKRTVLQERRDRAHLGVVVGWGIIEHALRAPESEVRQVALRILEAHLRTRPDDRPVAELRARMTAPTETQDAAE